MKKKTNKTKKVNKINFNIKDPKIIIIGIAVIAVLSSLYFLGMAFTVIITVGVGLIIGLARFLDKTKSKKKQRKIINYILIAILTLGIVGLSSVVLFLGYVVISAPKFNVNQLNEKESTIIYDKKNKEVTKLGVEIRENISYDNVSESLIDAIIATEDARFFQHHGFDAPRFMVATFGQLIGKSGAGGASTLSMQVVKNSFTGAEANKWQNLVRKFTDIYLSIFKLEKQFTKEQIFEFYINNHFLANNVYGVEQASQLYFGKSAKDINLSEAAIIAGMFQSPMSYDPYKFPNKTATRRNTVLYLMNKHGYINEDEWRAAKSIPVESLLVPKNTTTRQYQSYIDTVVDEVKAKYKVNPYVVPMLIYTNMDRDKQAALDDVFNGKTYTWENEKVQSGISAVDTNSGKVIAIGGGRNINIIDSINHATDINNQPGSTAKPLFDYGPGMEYNNWSTYTPFKDEPYAYTTGKPLNNWDGTFMGNMTLRNALALSRNVPALKAFQQVNNKKILEFVQNLGIRPEIDSGKIHEAHAIGAFSGVSPLEMSAAYAAFANGGYYYKPYTVNKVIFRSTKEEKTYESEKIRVMSDSTAYMITNILLAVPTYGMKVNNVTFAAKTGTTNFPENIFIDKNLPWDAIKDAWVIGYSPNISMGMWYGYDKIDNVYVSHNIPVLKWRDGLYKAAVNAVMDKNNAQFTKPNSVVEVGIEVGSNPAKLPSKNTPPDKIVYELFKSGTEPTEVSNAYDKIDPPTNLKVTYDETANKLHLSWSPSAPVNAKEEYGDFGYYIYQNDKEVGFTTKTTFDIKNIVNPDAEYKVVAAFKNYTNNKSNPITYTYSSFIAILYGDKTINLKINDNYKELDEPFKVIYNKKDITNSVEYTKTITDKDGEVKLIMTNLPNTYTITYKITYKEKDVVKYTTTLTRNVIISKE
ncbi:MAG: transglycosylase domain-containing protein [Bacilli bacterium]